MERDEGSHVCLTEDGGWAACPTQLCEARELLRENEELRRSRSRSERAWRRSVVLGVLMFVWASVPLPGWPHLLDALIYAGACGFFYDAGRES